MRIACIYVPDLSLQSLLRKKNTDMADAALSTPLVLATTQGARRLVSGCNDNAKGIGIQSGMTLAAARAMSPQLLVEDDDEKRADETLEALADTLGAVSPRVSLAFPDAVWVDLSHIGCGPVEARVLATLADEVGLGVRIGLASTAFAARALARFGDQPIIDTLVKGQAERQLLSHLPIQATGLSPDVIAALQVAGVHTLGDFTALPQSALARRFGTAAWTIHQQACGRKDAPWTPYRPIRPIVEKIQLADDPIGRLDQLCFHLKTLVDRSVKRLQGRSRGAVELVLRMSCLAPPERTVDSDELDLQNTRRIIHQVTLDMGHPNADAGLLLQLFRERLSSSPPTGPVTGVTLEVSRDAPLAFTQLQLFGQPPPPEPMAVTAARLTAMLGGDNRFIATINEDYRPEAAYALAPLNESDKPGPNSAQTQALPNALRPVRVLPVPVAVNATSTADAPLGAICGPERISGGWWDGRPAARDYWIVANENNRRSWIFRDLRTNQWFLHGHFD